MLSTIGALYYVQVDASIPKCGSNNAHIFEAFGPSGVYLLWTANFIFL
jgi:hypothetical protein